MTATEFEYAELVDLLARAGSPVSLAETHGSLCGAICAAGVVAGDSWLDRYLDECDGDAATIQRLTLELERLEMETRRALSGTSMEFLPLLPDDEAMLEHRTEALAAWCHGFLTGLVIGGVKFADDRLELATEIQEIIRDFAEISKAGVGDEEVVGDDNGEMPFAELFEYVRVSVQLVFEEFSPGPDVAASNTIH